ncbi:MAG TPA: RNA polymerase sporulation sigma factor SigE [Clostridiales bacterium]|nr:MAG: sporulation sigma factor SigE [Clostridiales bacterium GWD2_32_59]HAN10154.1 RNA polymerase sporulation sigma factor SigE [Clostridiales bacterium]
MSLKQLILKLKLLWINFIRKFNSDLGEGIHYINNNEVLPEPLKPEEEKVLIEKLNTCDRNKVKRELIERNLRLVVYLAKKFENVGIGLEDLVSIGNIGLIKAINTFEANKNIKLATYASKCIENEILMFVRKNNKTKFEVSIDEPLNVDWDGNELLLADVIGSEESNVSKKIEEEIDSKILKKCVEKLNLREKKIIELRYGIYNEGDELTQKEVADELGISQSYISRLEKKIIKKLKKEMAKLY